MIINYLLQLLLNLIEDLFTNFDDKLRAGVYEEASKQICLDIENVIINILDYKISYTKTKVQVLVMITADYKD